MVEKILIRLHQPRLPHRGTGLLEGQLLRIGRKPQYGNPRPDRAGTHQHHLVALLHQIRQGAHQMHDGRAVQRSVLTGQHARSYFHYDLHASAATVHQTVFPRKEEKNSPRIVSPSK